MTPATNNRPKQSGMIVRHFEHPSGMRATMEMPAGWSNACYFTVATYDADGNRMTGDGSGTHRFETPAEARAAASQRERDALAGGWRPRTGGPPVGVTVTPEAHLFRQNGERINCEITKLDMPMAVAHGDVLTFEEPEARIYDPRGPRAIKIIIEPLADVTINRRDRLELVRRQGIAAIQVMSISRSGKSITIHGHVRENRSTDPAALARAERAKLIESFVKDERPWTFDSLWRQIGLDPAEKTLVINEILKRRSEREAQAIRQEQIAAQRQREASERLAQERAQRENRERIIRQGAFQPLPKTNHADQKRKLSGGKDLGKPKPRKIDLGD